MIERWKCGCRIEVTYTDDGEARSLDTTFCKAHEEVRHGEVAPVVRDADRVSE